MSVITTDDIIWPAVVSFLAIYQLGQFAQKVGKARSKFKVSPPATVGVDSNFDRYFRAQQNTLEFFPLVMVSLWIGALFLHQVPSSVVGLLYLYTRQRYFDGYTESAERRLPPFYHGLRLLRVLFLFAVLGFAQSALTWYTGHNFKYYITKYLF